MLCRTCEVQLLWFCVIMHITKCKIWHWKLIYVYVYVCVYKTYVSYTSWATELNWTEPDVIIKLYRLVVIVSIYLNDLSDFSIV